MTEGEPRRRLTPCLVSRGVVANTNRGHGVESIAVHSRTDPCGYLTGENRRDPIPTFAEWVEDWAEDTTLRFTTCNYCGGQL